MIFGVYALYSNYYGGACEENAASCNLNYKTQFSYWNSAKKDKIAVEIQQYLSLATLITLIGLMQIMRWQVRVVTEECDEKDVSASDYTLFVENIPKNLEIDYETELKEFFESLTLPNIPKIVVEKVNLAYDLRDLPK